MIFDSYIITGTTASGKSDFAHNIAKKINGVIINCDSVQIYKGIENISASPFAGLKNNTDSIDNIPYKLFSILDLSKHLSVIDYLNLVKEEYIKAKELNKIPIFVGGTGFYINGIINGLSPIPDISEKNRVISRNMIEQDIEKAKRITEFKFTDPQRISRALEVLLETGKQISYWQNKERIKYINNTSYKILINPDKTLIIERIKKRIKEMLNSGAIEEAKNILNSNFDIKRAIGAKELTDYLLNKITKEECIKLWETNTIKYAKRQRTWFRTQFHPDFIINNIPKDEDTDIILNNSIN